MHLNEKDIGKAGTARDLIARLDINERENITSIGAKMKIWKQDPSVKDLLPRDVYIHTETQNGPKDSQIKIIKGKVKKDEYGNFLDRTLDLTKEKDVKELDYVHTYAVVRLTLTFYQRILKEKLVFPWNKDGGTTPVSVRIKDESLQAAIYSRGGKELKFGIHTGAQGTVVHTWRSFDMVAHETGHLVLDSLKPTWHPKYANTSKKILGAIHEAFGDCTALFMILSQFDLVEYIISETRANLRDNNINILSKLGEEYGLGSGQEHGFRNVANYQSLSKLRARSISKTDKYQYSLLLSNAIYEIIADVFALRRFPRFFDDAIILHKVNQEIASIFTRAIIEAPDDVKELTITDIAEQMKIVAIKDMNLDCADTIHRHFEERGIIIKDPDGPNYTSVENKIKNNNQTGWCIADQ